MDAATFISTLEEQADAARAADMARYHKADRRYLGLSNDVLNALATQLRRDMTPEARVELARDLWASDIHEARIAAAKLLTQERIRDDGAIWDLLMSWVPDFDAWAIADHACSAIGRRIEADLTRLDVVEGWTTSDHMWTRRAALVATLFLTKSNHPNAAESAARDRVLARMRDAGVALP